MESGDIILYVVNQKIRIGKLCSWYNSKKARILPYGVSREVPVLRDKKYLMTVDEVIKKYNLIKEKKGLNR